MKFTGRLTITGKIEVLTGLHIGTGGAAGIGLIDNPVIRDPLTRRPLIPGSSLKGRMRHALEILRDPASVEVTRVFGSAPEENDKGGFTRLYVRDSLLTDRSASELETVESESLFTEIKFENRIDRSSGVAENPRQSERLPAGTELDLELVYSSYASGEMGDDLQNIQAALQFVEDEYLGGSGSRGYGKVRFKIEAVSWKALEDYLSGKEARSVETNAKNWVQDAMKLAGAGAVVRS